MPDVRDARPRIIIHFDYDCFYASVVEHEDPALKSQPLAIQQKQIIVTCNYEARRRGLKKLQLITEAKKVCPDVIIVLGEDLTRFRDASKNLYNFLRAFSWNNKVERLGFDEVWLDVTDAVDYNLDLLNPYDLRNSFFQISPSDPTLGFAFDATALAGHAYPRDSFPGYTELDSRLLLGSHFALHIRHQLEEQKGYTSTVGISTSKLISKLVGNLNKPKGQTTLLPPYDDLPDGSSNVHHFLDNHEIGAVPWIGFKLAQKLREHALGRPATFDYTLIYGGTRELVTVGTVRRLPDMSPESLEKLLGGPGAPHGIGLRVHSLLHGIDDTPVLEARNTPRQISIEDSYIRLDTAPHVLRELTSLATRLLQRMRIDLIETRERGDTASPPRWLAKPATLRLSTRPRPPVQADGTRVRSFKRISRSTPMPGFVFGESGIDAMAARLVGEALLPLFRRLHPEKSGWNLSLVNVAAADMAEAASDSHKGAAGRDISSMFRNQDSVLREFRVVEDGDEDKEGEEQNGLGPSEGEESARGADVGNVGDDTGAAALRTDGDADADTHAEDVELDDDEETEWQADEDGDQATFSQDDYVCTVCHQSMPLFARTAHERFHETAGNVS